MAARGSTNRAHRINQPRTACGALTTVHQAAYTVGSPHSQPPLHALEEQLHSKSRRDLQTPSCGSTLPFTHFDTGTASSGVTTGTQRLALDSGLQGTLELQLPVTALSSHRLRVTAPRRSALPFTKPTWGCNIDPR